MFTLAAQRWACKYFPPYNSYGYRDHEPDFSGKKIVFVVGDSFVKGNGIEYIDDRFSNLLAKKLGSNWTVTILANGGWSPPDYLRALERHDRTPDFIVVSYYINDIEAAADLAGLKRPFLRVYPNKYLQPFY